MPTQNLLRFATVDDEGRVGNSLMHTWDVKPGNKTKICSDFEHKVLMLKFRQDF